MTKFVVVLLALVALVAYFLVSSVGGRKASVNTETNNSSVSTYSNSNSSDNSMPIQSSTPAMVNNNQSNTLVLLKTNKGDIKLEIYTKTLPITAGNFVKLVSNKFYDGVIFHRIIDGFMIQGGDPTGTGMGGPGYKIADEFAKPNKNDRGTISMANAGANTGGSQFFINLVNNNGLDTKHPVFGKVVSGMEVVDAIAVVETDASDRPLKEIKIESATVVEK